VRAALLVTAIVALAPLVAGCPAEKERAAAAATAERPAAPTAAPGTPSRDEGLDEFILDDDAEAARARTSSIAARVARETVDSALAPAENGARLFRALGCGECHRLGGVGGANGPPLDGVGARVIARQGGSEAAAMTWLRDHLLDPERFPGPEKPRYPAISMPPIGIPPEQADLVAAYLLTLRSR
jgi:mono/diheme cytochrome c family protein